MPSSVVMVTLQGSVFTESVPLDFEGIQNRYFSSSHANWDSDGRNRVRENRQVRNLSLKIEEE